MADVREAVETGVGAPTATEVIDGRKRFPVVVRLDDPYRGTRPSHRAVLLNDARRAQESRSRRWRIQMVEGPEVHQHEDGQRIVVVQSNVRGRDLGSFVAEVQRAVAAA